MATTTDSGHLNKTQGEPGRARGASIPLGARKARFSRGYGMMVSWLKVLLPTIAVALTILVIVWPHLEQQERRFGERLLGLDETQAENLEVLNPRYTGIEENGNPYSVSADIIRQADVDSPIVDLVEPKADIQLDTENWALISAISGRMDREAQVLELYEEVNLFHDLGYEFHTKNLTIDLVAGSAYGFDPVWGQGPFGEIEGEGVQIHDRGARVQLTGKSKVIIRGGGEE